MSGPAFALEQEYMPFIWFPWRIFDKISLIPLNSRVADPDPDPVFCMDTDPDPVFKILLIRIQFSNFSGSGFSPDSGKLQKGL